jgi:hypothetical protein
VDFKVKMLIAGAIFVILMVVFGNNPMENPNKPKRGGGGKDQALEDLKEFEEDNKTGKNLFTHLPTGGGGSAASSGTFTRSGSGSFAQQPPHFNTTGRPGQGRYTPNQNNFNRQQGLNPYPQGSAPPNWGVQGGNGAAQPPPPSQWQMPSNELPGGQKLKFMGSEVYIERDGKQVKLPDGEYHLSDGYPVMIHNGRRYLPSD